MACSCCQMRPHQGSVLATVGRPRPASMPLSAMSAQNKCDSAPPRECPVTSMSHSSMFPPAAAITSSLSRRLMLWRLSRKPAWTLTVGFFSPSFHATWVRLASVTMSSGQQVPRNATTIRLLTWSRYTSAVHCVDECRTMQHSSYPSVVAASPPTRLARLCQSTPGVTLTRRIFLGWNVRASGRGRYLSRMRSLPLGLASNHLPKAMPAAAPTGPATMAPTTAPAAIWPPLSYSGAV
mmetsp:Transcript_79580/g.140421  ORF Transcript_79580/g.140421 Transcript_79580/m.140421 type:complete len:237 (-) Transcript_79580:1335-2045(-)